MTEGEAKELIFVCPYHGRRGHEDATTMKTCRKCVEELGVSAGDATMLRREPYQGHAPRWQYDCARCKFAWCCGPQCACHIQGKMPKERRAEVERAAEMFQKRRRQCH